MNDTDRIAEIRQLADAATEGPWVYEPPEAIDGPAAGLHYVSTQHAQADDDPPLSSFFDEPDARFVAASRAGVPFLLDEIGQLYTWHGLMRILDRHWPESVFPTLEDDVDRDAGPRIVSLLRWVDQLRTERTEFIDVLGFEGPNESTSLTMIQDSVAMAMADAEDHAKCPVVCEGGCGETLASTVCPRCNGGGSTSTSGYEECGDCGGDRFIHEGCVGKTYAELVAELEQARAELALSKAYYEAAARQRGSLDKPNDMTAEEARQAWAKAAQEQLAEVKAERDRLAAAIQRVRDIPELTLSGLDDGQTVAGARSHNALRADIHAALTREVPDAG